MKKTFRLAAVLVTLAALVMASCQNAAGGSGGGGGGVTPSPTPPSPEPAELVKGDAIQLVGSYEIDKFARLILGPDGNGVLNFSAPSASTRSILLDDYPFKWEITKGDENVEIDGLVSDDTSGNVDEEEDVTVPYLKLTFEEGANVKVTGTIKYLKNDGADKTDKSGEFELDDGFPLNINYADATNGVLSLSDYDMTGTDPVFNGKILPGILGTIEIDGVEFEVKNSSGDPLDPNPPKAAELAGAWSVVFGDGMSSITYVDGSDTKGVEGDSVEAKFMNIPEITKDKGTGATQIYMVTGIVVTNGGATADVDVIIYDYDTIKKSFKDDGTYTVASEDGDDVSVSGIEKLFEEDTDDERGFATAVIADCTVTVSSGNVVLTKAKYADPVNPLDVTTVLTLKPNVPFADAPNMVMKYNKGTGGADVDVNKLMFQEGVVTE